jgi:hypothetical protein
VQQVIDQEQQEMLAVLGEMDMLYFDANIEIMNRCEKTISFDLLVAQICDGYQEFGITK